MVVPVSCVSHGGLEQVTADRLELTCVSRFMLAEATVAVLVVPVSCVSQGGLEQTSVTAVTSSTHLIIPPIKHCIC